MDALGAPAYREFNRWHVARKHTDRYFTIAKLEIVCRDKDAKRFMRIVKQYGHTGETGDSRASLTNVEDGINIRTGREGEAAL